MTRGEFVKEFLEPLPDIHQKGLNTVFNEINFLPTKSKVEDISDEELEKYILQPKLQQFSNSYVTKLLVPDSYGLNPVDYR